MFSLLVAIRGVRGMEQALYEKSQFRCPRFILPTNGGYVSMHGRQHSVDRCRRSVWIGLLAAMVVIFSLSAAANAAVTISIGAPSTTATKSGPVNYTITYGGATSVTLAAANVTLNKTGTATGTVTVSGTGTTTRTVKIDHITGDGTLSISIAASTATDGQGNFAPAAGPSAEFSADNTLPTISISAPSVTQTEAGPIDFIITYVGADTVTLATNKVTLNKTGTANGTVSISGTDNTTRTVTISNITGDGTLSISIGTDTASDAAGNKAPAAGPSATVIVDNPPSVTIGAPSTASTKTGPVTYTITYANAASITLSSSDVTLNQTGTAFGTVAVSGTGTTTRTVTISNITGDGTLGISIAAGTAVDAGGKPAHEAGPSVTFDVDRTPPTVSIGAPSETNANSGPVNYTVTYGGASTVTLAVANVTLIKTGTATGRVTVSGNGTTTRTVKIDQITGNGTLGISIAAGTATDAMGNVALSAGPSDTFIADNTAPTVSIGPPSTTLTTTGPVSYTVTYTGADTITLTASKVNLVKSGTNGTITVSGTDNTTRIVTISNITGNGTLAISLDADTASDAAGNNAPSAPTSTAFTVDNTKPTLVISSPSATLTRNGPVTFTVTYTGADAVTLSETNVTLNHTGTAAATISVSGAGTATRIVTLSDITGDGTLGISIAAGTASDAAGNTALEKGPSGTFTVDNTIPTISIDPPSATVTKSGPITFKIQYSGASSVTLTEANVSLNRTGSANGTINVTGLGQTARTVTVSNITGEGTLGISIVAGTATDTAGNLAPATDPSGTFIVDNTPPESFTPTATPASWTNGSTVQISFSTTDSGTGIKSYTVAVDSGNYHTYSSPYVMDVSTISDGMHVVHVSASDQVSNVRTCDVNIYLDKTAPAPGIASSPATADSSPIAVSYSGASDVNSGLKAVHLWSKKGSAGVWADTGLSSTGGSDSFAFIPDSDETYYFDLVSEDNVGNMSATPTGDGDTNTVFTSTPLSVTSVSSSSSDGVYVAGDSISVQVTFSKPVTVVGTPQIEMETGSVKEQATYVSGSGTNVLTFLYQVQPGDTSADLEYTGTGALTLNGGTVTSAGGANADLTLPAPGAAGSLSANKNLMIITQGLKSVVEAKAAADDTNIQLLGPVVTRVFGNYLYIEDPDRTSGIRVNITGGQVPSEGAVVGILGTVRTVDGERVIDNATVGTRSSGTIPSSLGMNGSAASRILPQGLLVMLYGTADVANDATDTFVLKDGLPGGIRVRLHGVALPTSGLFFRVTGTLGADAEGAILYVNASGDLREIKP